MFCRVPYTDIGGRHRPYLEVVFSDETRGKHSNKTFAMVDSGADHTVIPYSLGSAIGLAAPTEAEQLANVSGVGGNLSYIERKCHIYLANRATNKVYVFKETVWWIHPDAATLAQQQQLIQTFGSFANLQTQTIPSTELHVHFENEKLRVIGELTKISNRLETSVLLGRPFFDNFEFIQFFHRDRSREDKASFNYKVANKKPVEIVPLEQTALLGNVVASVRAQ